jgi:NADH-quinone oxidoreductase subunit N
MGIQSVDLWVMAPTIVLALGALLALLVDLFVAGKGKASRSAAGLTAVAAVVAATALLPQSVDEVTLCAGQNCAYAVGALTIAIQLVVLVGTITVLLLSLVTVDDSRTPSGEYYFLLLASASGAMLVPAVTDLVTLLVAIEVVSLPTFALIAMNRGDRRSGEAALKAFLYSVASAAISFYGLALLYGSLGTVSFGPISLLTANTEPTPIAAAGLVLILAVVAFKAAAVPFHAWAPDAYEGAPVPIAAYLSVVSKAVGFAALIQIVASFATWEQIWAPVVAALAILTMVFANVIALRQKGAVRLLAWSSVAQAGYILVPLAAIVGGLTGAASALPAVIGYLVGYAALNLGAFAVVTIASRKMSGRTGLLIADMKGLAWQSPWLGLTLAFFLAGLAGLPPALIGLFIKVQVIAVPVSTGAWIVVAVMVLATVTGLAYYLRFAAALFSRPAHARFDRSHLGITAGPAHVALGAMLVLTIVLSVAPSLALGLLDRL